MDALFAAAAPHGLLLVLDDLHWADTGSTQLLVHIARAIGSAGWRSWPPIGTPRRWDRNRSGPHWPSWVASPSLRACTSRAAAVRGLGAHKGRIAPGYDADLLIVDGDPLVDLDVLHRIRAVYVRGTKLVGER